MNDRRAPRTFASRPGGADKWVRAPDPRHASNGATAEFSARLTIDVTPDLRGRIKIAAFQHGVTVAHMLRDLLSREFPPSEGDTP
ncbi:ribbon-helix-helix protein [Propylenella binzhouense]|uniref:Plasmid segregation centromere-binding protein ParG n=1 Tax=Propylenella binzhouense TaxID=2555902 RepID=A0A964WRU6_9HYPH|nr:hypothetical protein [Propylenella binzhouense]MYZ46160.1 hypothetical protein [Propylenella binzhouense]